MSGQHHDSWGAATRPRAGEANVSSDGVPRCPPPSTDAVTVSPARMLAACRQDARRVARIAVPLFTAGFVLEAVSHAADPHARMFLQPLLSAMLCGGVLVMGRSLLHRVPYPELILMLLLGLVVWSIASHLPAVQETTRASTLVMLAVAAVGSATLIMPTVAAVFAIGATTGLYVYAQSVYVGMTEPTAWVAPILVLMVVILSHFSRRSAIRSVEELQARVELEHQQLELANEQLRSLSITDPLTGTLNRRGFDDRLRAELAGAVRGGESLSVLLLDVDHFKGYNDEFGHPAGDAALQRAAEALLACCRVSDSVARYGGEEFALILPATDAPGCQRMAERVRQAIATLDGLARPITVSVGAATIQPATMTGLSGAASELVAGADGALYRAKQGGRNRAEFTALSSLAGTSES